MATWIANMPIASRKDVNLKEWDWTADLSPTDKEQSERIGLWRAKLESALGGWTEEGENGMKQLRVIESTFIWLAWWKQPFSWYCQNCLVLMVKMVFVTPLGLVVWVLSLLHLNCGTKQGISMLWAGPLVYWFCFSSTRNFKCVVVIQWNSAASAEGQVAKSLWNSLKGYI